MFSYLKFIVVLCLFTPLVLSSASAAPKDRVWSMTTDDMVCRVSLIEDTGRIGAGDVRQLDRTCRIGAITRYEVGEAGSLLFLDDGGTLIARVDPLSRGQYSGLIGDGDPLDFSLIPRGAKPPPNPGPVFTPRPKPDFPNGRGQSAATCLRYPDTGVCARNEDVGLPGDRFNLLPVETRARMNVHFMANVSSSVEGQVAPGTCLPVRNCTESLLNKEIWCDVNWKDGEWGWILKQDSEYVYAQESCG